MPRLNRLQTHLSSYYTVLHFLVPGIVLLVLVACQSPVSETEANTNIITSTPTVETPTIEPVAKTPTKEVAIVQPIEGTTEAPAATETIEIEIDPTTTVEPTDEAISVTEIVRVSVSSDGSEVADNSPMRPNNLPMDISADGRFIVFYSRALGLDVADTNDLSDVFVHDLETSITERVSLSSESDDTRGESHSPAISNDGQRIAFLSWGLSIDGVQEYGIYLADRSNGSLTFVAPGFNPDISGDGNTIVFVSDSAELSENDTNEYADVYAYDVSSGMITLISKSPAGAAGDGTSNFPAVSQDGSRIAFISMATNLAEDENGSESDIFIYDAGKGEITRLAGTERAESVMLSDDGQWVVFPRGANSVRKSVDSPDNRQSISGIAFSITADGNRIVYLKPPIGLYLYDVQQGISVPLSIALDGEFVSAYSAAISSSGNAVVFESPYPELVENDTNGTYDIFVAMLNSP